MWATAASDHAASSSFAFSGDSFHQHPFAILTFRLQPCDSHPFLAV